MVNTGRPSGACGVCRERRIKCDETKPACLKCIRSGRSCSGYSHGLKLRDQTQKTIIKAKFGKPRGRRKGNGAGQGCVKSPASSINSASSVSSIEDSPSQEAARPRSFSLPSRSAPRGADNSESRGHKRSSSGDSLRKSVGNLWSLDLPETHETTADAVLWQMINIPLAEQARCYFLSSYVIYGPKSDLGMFTFIPQVLSSDAPAKVHFEHLFTAISIAAFSLRGNASHISASSRYYYGKGVAELRKVLGDKELVKSDTVLASTILLGFYEGLVNDGASIVSYNPHFEAAITLLRFRGDEQFSTPQGTEMFDFVMQVMMRQYELSLHMTEDDLSRWTMQASKHAGVDRPHLTAMWVADLRSKVARLTESQDRSPESIQSAMKILSSAQKFEWLVTQRFEAEKNEMPGEKGLNQQMQKPNDGVIQTTPPVAVYPDWWSATRALNKFAFRLLLCHIIADISTWLNDGTGLFQGSGFKAAKTAREDIDSIMASLPYLCDRKADEHRGASSPCGRDDLSSVEGITSLLVIWPLYLAGESRFATAEQKEHIMNRLGWIGDNMGVKHASGVSQHLKLIANGNTPSRPPVRELGIEDMMQAVASSAGIQLSDQMGLEVFGLA